MRLDKLKCLSHDAVEPGSLIFCGEKRVHAVVNKHVEVNGEIQPARVTYLTGSEAGTHDSLIRASLGWPVLVYPEDWWIDVDVNSSVISAPQKLGDIVAASGGNFMRIDASVPAYLNLENMEVRPGTLSSEEIVIFKKWSICFGKEHKATVIFTRD